MVRRPSVALQNIMRYGQQKKTVDTNLIGKNFNDGVEAGVDNKVIIAVNEIIRYHPIESIGAELRQAMTEMKTINTVA